LVDDSDPTRPPDDKPWLPFHSREDFEFVELVHNAALNRPQIERLIGLFQRCQKGPGSLTFKKYNDLKDSLESASKMLTPVTMYLPPLSHQFTRFGFQFQCHKIEHEFEGEKKTYKTWCRPL